MVNDSNLFFIFIGSTLKRTTSSVSLYPSMPQFIKPLFDELMKVNKADEKLAKTGKILLQADQNLPYATLRKIMYTASMAGFPNLKLITTVSE